MAKRQAQGEKFKQAIREPEANDNEKSLDEKLGRISGCGKQTLTT